MKISYKKLWILLIEKDITPDTQKRLVYCHRDNDQTSQKRRSCIICAIENMRVFTL